MHGLGALAAQCCILPHGNRVRPRDVRRQGAVARGVCGAPDAQARAPGSGVVLVRAVGRNATVCCRGDVWVAVRGLWAVGRWVRGVEHAADGGLWGNERAALQRNGVQGRTGAFRPATGITSFLKWSTLSHKKGEPCGVGAMGDGVCTGLEQARGQGKNAKCRTP